MSILYLSLLSPITELHPNIYMSWWYPPNKNIHVYDNLYYLRIFIVLAVWIPILIKLQKYMTMQQLILFGILIFSAFIGRELTKKSGMPVYLYMVSLLIIGMELYTKSKQIIIALLLILSGGYLIDSNRYINLNNDISGRLIFSFGFILFLNIINN